MSDVAQGMKYDVRFGIVATLAFAAGVAVARLPLPAHAAAAPLQPQTIDMAAMTADNLPPPTATFPNLHSKTVVVTDGMTAAVQTGGAVKHYHADANELQIVLEGSGTEWLGDKQVSLKPGTLVVIPKGTAHAAFTETSGHLKWLSLKTPPQDPADVHPL
jgi:mannose-6-phosphate isomerase-like protein (cupin superfamily)